MKPRVISIIVLSLFISATAFSTNTQPGGCSNWECSRTADTAECKLLFMGEPQPGEPWQKASTCTNDYRQCMYVFDETHPNGGGYVCWYDCNMEGDCYSV
jgi:hypothetical protein